EPLPDLGDGRRSLAHLHVISQRLRGVAWFAAAGDFPTHFSFPPRAEAARIRAMHEPRSPHLARRAAGLEKTLIRQVFDEAAPGAINLGLGQPAIDPPPAVMERLAQAARDNKAAYTPNAGDKELRERIAQELFDGAPMESVIITI